MSRAFKPRPEGAKAPSPGQASVASDTLGLRDTTTMRPEGAKAVTDAFKCGDIMFQNKNVHANE